MKRNTCIYGIGIGVFMMVLLASCGSRRRVTGTRTTSDTLILVQHDTAYVASHTLRTDTVKERELHLITIRVDSGRTDTVRVETVTDRWHKAYVSDSSRFFRQQADSLLKVMRKEAQRTETTKGRGLSKWQQWKRHAFAFSLGGVVALLLVLPLLRAFSRR